jgi:peptidoglycan hydrolase-like protein with peptidoglycan-binding domain
VTSRWRRPAVAIAAALSALGPGCGGVQKVEERAPVEEPQKRKPEAPDSPSEAGVKPRSGGPRVPAAPEGLLAPGAVGEIQEALAKRGLLGRHARGELDDPTSAALRKFQEKEGLAATGMPDRETLLRLGVSAEKAYGREGEGSGEAEGPTAKQR